MQGNWDFYNEAKLKLFLILAENVKERRGDGEWEIGNGEWGM